jgi:dihydropteroate synthase
VARELVLIIKERHRIVITTLHCGNQSVELSRVAVMGILNVTPDSFSDGGRYTAVETVVRHAVDMVSAGAAIIDVGGESTRPGARPVSVQEELDRVIPVIEEVRREVSTPISIDTSKPEVMDAAVAAGAGMINDVSALRMPDTLETVARLDVPVCLMHMQGEPRTMQEHPSYDNVLVEVRDFLEERKQACLAAGIAEHRLIFDPGFGFGKTLEHNLILLRQLQEFRKLNAPLSVGLSRKSMIGMALDLPVEQRLHASVALALMAVQNGANIIRVHDVTPTVDAIRMYEAVYRAA